MAYYHQDENGNLILLLHLHTGSKRNQVDGVYAGRLRVRVTAQPVENRANKVLIAFLATEFAVKKADVSILSGLHSRNKKVAVAGYNRLPDWLLRADENRRIR